MARGRSGVRQFRFDHPESVTGRGPSWEPTAGSGRSASVAPSRLESAVERTRDFLLARQHAEGYWLGELEGDTILESEYLLLLTYLGRETSETARLAANYIREKQLPEGGWALYPGGPLEISASVKAYFTLKLTGDSPEAEHMIRAREAILQAGGAERVNSFTRYYLALLGVLSYEQCPAVPPELVLIPRWMPFNIYEMSAWSRTIVIPLSLLWAHRPVRRLPPEKGIRELFLRSPEELPADTSPSAVLGESGRPSRINWEWVFGRLDRFLKLLDRWRLRPLRKRAVRCATRWMFERFENSDGLGAIFPPIIWSVVGLKCLGYPDDSPEVQAALGELEKLWIREGETLRLQPCKSPVWDTAITTLALRDADLPPEHPAIRRAVEWLLSKESRRTGDWAQKGVGRRSPGVRSSLIPDFSDNARRTSVEPSGWYFEFHNAFYPDIDDTTMVLLALGDTLPVGRRSDGNGWSAELVRGNGHHKSNALSAVVSGRDADSESARRKLDALEPQLAAIRRGLQWLFSMQSRDGGWGAFDRDNTRELFTRVPFADHNAMIDPSSADLTARVLELSAVLGISKTDPAVRRAAEFLWTHQEDDGCWYGRWGVNYIYGTWQALVGLRAIGVPETDERIRRAVEWLNSKQQPNGAWGETPRSYDDPSLRGRGRPTASQTAWALMGLMAAGETRSEAVRRGIEYLLETQRDDGTWDEPWFTGTGFPRVFYLKYHLYRIYFPLMALARYQRLSRDGSEN